MNIRKVLLIGCCMSLFAVGYTQSLKEFADGHQTQRVMKGDTVLIKAEYATVFSAQVTDKLDKNRIVYDSLRKSYQKLIAENKKLIKALKSSQSNIETLIANNNSEASTLNRISDDFQGNGGNERRI